MQEVLSATSQELIYFLRSRNAIVPEFQAHALHLAEQLDKSGLAKPPRTPHERAALKLKNS